MAEEGFSKLAAGKRLVAFGDSNGAVDCFEEAVQLLSVSFGETARELADPYFQYGTALLTVCRRDAQVFGGGGAGGDNGDDDEAAEEGGASASSSASASGAGPSSSSAATENSVVDEAPVDADADNLQIAWEVLELSRHIYEQTVLLDRGLGKDASVTSPGELRIAEIHNLLGEHNLETDLCDQALEEFRKSLGIRQRLLKENDRRIAESHYNMALAYKYKQDFEQSVRCVSKAVEVLRSRLSNIDIDIAQARQGTSGGSGVQPTTAAQLSAGRGKGTSGLEKERATVLALVREIESEGKELEKCKQEATQIKGALRGVLEGLKGAQAPSAENAAANSESASEAGITTIGFGAPPPMENAASISSSASSSTASTVSGGTTTVGFGATPEAAGEGPTAVNQLVVKRKKPTTSADSSDVSDVNTLQVKRARLQ